jgi:all-trans-retinol dehydrogenase (NAD+)
MTNVNQRICLVTGAASGIGRLLSLELADRGAHLVLWDMDADRLEAAVGEVRRRGGKAWGFRCDVTDRAMVDHVADQVRADVGDPTVVVNNAGVVSGQRLIDLAPEQIERTFAVNVLALYWVTKAFLPAMLAHGEGHVVTVASAAGLVGVARQTDYSASKHAAVGFDESLRMELRRMGSRLQTTVVCPYYIDTGMFEGVKTKRPLLLPILKQDKVARKIACAIERDRRTVILPPFIRLLPITRVLPVGLFDRLMDLFGVNQSMDEFVGRAEEHAEPMRRAS